MILEFQPFGPADTNAILLGCEKTRRAAIFDAPWGCVGFLEGRAEKLGLSIEKILFTHSHWDHIVDAAELKKRFCAKIYIHSEDRGNLMHPGSDGLPLFFPVAGAEPDGFLSDGEKLRVGELQIEVIHTPGHTPGGVCFYLESEQLLISGDTLFRAAIGNLSFPTARPALMWKSLKKLLSLPPNTRVIPGHGEETTIGKETAMIQNLLKRSENE